MPPKELPKGDAPTDKPPKKRSRFKLIMLVLGLLLLLGGGGGAGYWWLYLRPDATGLAGLFGSSDKAAAPADAPAPGPAESGSSPARNEAGAENPARSDRAGGAQTPRAVQRPVPLPSFTVNLADPPGNRYLKIGMEVEFNTPEAAAAIQEQSARVRDAIILLLSSKTVQGLSTAEGKVLLKNEVAGRLNQVLGAPRVVRVYFTDFVIQ